MQSFTETVETPTLQSSETPSSSELERSLLEQLLHELQEMKAVDILSIDVHEHSSLADHMIICEGTSQAHVRGIAEQVSLNMKSKGIRAYSIEGKDEGSWVLMDYNDVLLHIFHPETRQFYSIEQLYHYCPQDRITEGED